MEQQQKKLKRRLTFNGVIDGRRSNKGEEEDNGNGNGEVQRKRTTEEEVDEFFAIIRELHTAFKHLRKGNPNPGADSCGKKRKIEKEEKGASWRPVFECGDFEEIEGFKMDDDDDNRVDLQQQPNKEKEKEKMKMKITTAIKVGFDLNEDPVADES